ncbi:T9SS type A sorting domain-containing protein [Aquimarina addita]
MKTLNCLVLLLLGCSNADSQEQVSNERDAWLWPFSKNSIWNQPIGSDAVYTEVNFENASNVGVDIQHILALNFEDPERAVVNAISFEEDRCGGTDNLGFTIKVPDTWVVPDAGDSPYGLTPNDNFAFRLSNSDIVFEGSQISRCMEAGPVHLPSWMQYPDNRNYQSIKGDGLAGGGQGASGMSALGGTIRKGELISEIPIRHAIKINPWAAKYCFYSEEIKGYKWPANDADNYASTEYKGTNQEVVMGSLFAIPPQVTPESVGLMTVAGEKLFFAMQNYGVYFTEDAAWDTWDIIVERDSELEFEEAYGFSMSSIIWKDELNKLMKALAVISNNSIDQIGGGGAPLQPLAPDFQEHSLSSETFGKKDFKMFPNPLKKDFISFDTQVSSVEIFTVQGVLMNSFTDVQAVHLQLRPGIYIVKISKGTETIAKQLVKQ